METKSRLTTSWRELSSQGKTEGETLEIDTNKPSNTHKRVKSRVIGKMNSFWCLSLLPSQHASWHTFNSSVARRATQSAWESAGGRAGRMKRKKESVSRHQKAISADQGECIPSPICCSVMMPNSDTTASAVSLAHFCLYCPPQCNHPPYSLAFTVGTK